MTSAAVGTIGTRAMLGAFQALGLDARAIQAEAGFTDRELENPDGLLPADRFYRMWEAADRAWGRPSLGMHAGAKVPFGAYEVLDYLLLSAGTLEDGLTEFAKYFPIATRTSRYRITLETGTAVCEMIWRTPPSGIMFQLRDYSMAAVSGRILHTSGRRAERIELSGPPLATVQEYSRGFGVPVAVRAARTAAIYSLDVWRLPLIRRDDDLNRTLRRHAQLLLQRQPAGTSESLADRVRGELLGTAQVGVATLDAIADRLGVSPRTLQRRLREEGTSFDRLCDDVRAGLAQEYLGDRGLSVSEVGYLVGFSEPSAFTRAFRRWTGKSPQEHRARAISAPSA